MDIISLTSKGDINLAQKFSELTIDRKAIPGGTEFSKQ